MKNQRTKLTINLIVILATLSISLTSFLYLTFSWFTFVRTQNTNVLAITAESGTTYELKYFVKNYLEIDDTVGYPGPDSILLPENRITVDDYATDFAPISEDPLYSGTQQLTMTAKYPGLRFTYALEVSGDFNTDKVIELLLGNYSAPPSTTLFDSVTLSGITLAKAINLYATTIDMSENLTTQANAFVTGLASSDKFTSTAPYGSSNISLTSGNYNPAAAKLIFLFTVEFSNLSNTFYKLSYINGANSYFAPNVLGNSNVYKGLSFTISLLRLHVY